MNVWSKVSKILPEGRFKEKLRMVFTKYYVRYKIIKSTKILQDENVTFLELNNGFKFYSDSNRTVIYQMLIEQFFGNVYEKRYELKEKDVVVDVGAHIGTFTIKAAKEVGNEGKVIAIEPEENNLKLLKRNVEINGLKNVIIVQKGIWSEKDEMRLYLSDYSICHSLVCEDTDKSVDIEVDTIDNILNELKVNKVDFIKMDIEGAEIEALKGAKETLENNNVKIAIAAYHEINGEPPTSKTIVPQLKRMGFKTDEENGMVYGEKSR